MADNRNAAYSQHASRVRRPQFQRERRVYPSVYASDISSVNFAVYVSDSVSLYSRVCSSVYVSDCASDSPSVSASVYSSVCFSVYCRVSVA